MNRNLDWSLANDFHENEELAGSRSKAQWVNGISLQRHGSAGRSQWADITELELLQGSV